MAWVDYPEFVHITLSEADDTMHRTMFYIFTVKHHLTLPSGGPRPLNPADLLPGKAWRAF